MEKIQKFKYFQNSDTKLVKESKAKKDWTVGDVKKVEKQLKLVITREKALHKSKEKLQSILDNYVDYKQGDKIANNLAFQKNPESFLEILRQMFPDIITK